MRLFLIAALLAGLAMPAYAQMGGIGASQGAGRASASGPKETPEEAAQKKAEEKVRERAFNDAVKRIPAPAKKFDPWGTVRSTGDSR
jgi:hypothetical protein